MTKLALTTMALALLPATAAAQVDQQAGPVAFANIASVKVVDGGSVITETQRSPRTAGFSQLSPDRVAVPKDEDERKAVGPNYLLRLGSSDGGSPFPSREHHVAASLAETGAPSAVAETSYSLQDAVRGNTVVAFQDAKTEVSCPGPGRLTGTVTAAKLWVRGADDVLRQVGVQDSVEVKGAKLGPPGMIEGIDAAATTSDLTISRLTTFDQLLRQEEWRGGDLTVVAGWRIDVVTHVVKTDTSRQDVTTQIVLGGVSCSIPRTFVAVTPTTSTAPAEPEEEAVPVKIPSGGGPDTHGNRPLGFALLGGGVLFGVGAIVLWRRKRGVG